MVSTVPKASNLEATLQKIFFIPQLIGVLPYSWLRGKFVYSWWRVSYTFIIIFLLVFFLGNRIFAKESNHNSESIFEWQIAMIKFSVSSISTAGSITALLFNRNDLNFWLGSMRKAEHSMRILGHQEYRAPLRFQLVNMTAIGLLFLVDLRIYNSVYYLMACWGYYMSSVINVALVEQFRGQLVVVEQGFRKIIRSLEKTGAPRHMDAGVITFDILTNAAEEVNNAQGPQLLIIMASSFILVTINAFLVINDLDNSKKLLFLFCCLMSAVPPWRLVEACHNVIEQREEFNIQLNRRLIEEKHLGSLENVKVNLHIAMKRELEFTAMGFFNIDYPLINSMAGATATYLVILLQFDNKSG